MERAGSREQGAGRKPGRGGAERGKEGGRYRACRILRGERIAVGSPLQLPTLTRCRRCHGGRWQVVVCAYRSQIGVLSSPSVRATKKISNVGCACSCAVSRVPPVRLGPPRAVGLPRACQCQPEMQLASPGSRRACCVVRGCHAPISSRCCAPDERRYGSLIGTALVAVSLADGGAPRPSD